MREFYPLPGSTERAVLTRDGSFRLESVPLVRPGPGELLFLSLIHI